MSHTYASVADLIAAFDQTSASWSGNNAALLDLLASASRRVDAYANRRKSGFGPRTGTNKYDWWGDSEVLLRDDLLSVTTCTVLDGTGGASSTAVVDTDFYLNPADTSPKRFLFFHGLTSVAISSGYRVLQIAGSWGYQDERMSIGTLTLSDATTTSASLAGGSASMGMTLLSGSEQVYVTAETGGTALTVVRGVNGTTAAGGTAAASYYTYPDEVSDATIRLAMRRWRMNQAGLSGEIGGGDLPATTQRDTESSILRSLHHLKVYGA